MERATIITLGNATPMSSTSFEEAFGEFSEARGRGRARRQKRRMERINNRRQRRKARQDMRLERKRNRVSARAERRQMRSTARENRRNQRSEGKRSRERADLEQEREFNPEQEEEQQGGGSDDGGYAPQGGYDDAPQGDSGYAPQGGSSDGAYDDGGYAQEEGGYDDGGSSDGGYDEGGYDEESEGFDGDYDDFDGDDFDYFDGDDLDGDDGDDETDGFDGELYDFDGNSEMIDAPVSPQVNQNIMDAAKRIEWNLELASRLKEKGNSPKVEDAMCKCEDRVAELVTSMDGYCSFDGDFTSDADGKLKYQVAKGMKQLPLEERKKRWREVKAAKMKARLERNAMRKKNGLNQVATPVATTPALAVSVGTPAAAVSVPMKAQLMQKRTLYRKQILSLKMRMAALRKQYLTDAAKNKPQPEQLALKQQFVLKRNAIKSRMEALKKQYLEQVNAIKMNKGVSSATGIIGLDDAGDYDATGYEIKLGADGTKTSKIPFKAIAIGLVIGGLGVFLLKKYKVI
jgi:hypothetical protein